MVDRKKLRVRVIQDGEIRETASLEGGRVRLGRPVGSTGAQALLESQDDGSFLLIDLGEEGTLVNQERITRGTVRDGDELRFGDVVVEVELVDAEEAPALPVDRGGEEIRPERFIVLSDGSIVEPFTMEGYYDEDGNYVPGYYDETGRYHYGYGFYDGTGAWVVAHGYYDPEGEWIPTVGPERESDRELYTETFFQDEEDEQGDVLEVAYLWADYVLDVQSHRKPRTITVGSAEGNDYVLEDPAVPSSSFPLVSFVEGRGYCLNYSPAMAGLVQRDGEQFTLQEAAARGEAVASTEADGLILPLRPGMSVRVGFGPNTFLIRFTTPVEVGAGMGGVQRAPLFYQGVSLTLHLAFMLLIFTLPDGFARVELHDFQAQDRFVEIVVPPDQEEEDEWVAALEEISEEAAMATEPVPSEDPPMTADAEGEADDWDRGHASDEEVALNAGVLEVFANLDDPFGGPGGPDGWGHLIGEMDHAGDGPGDDWGSRITGPRRLGEGDNVGVAPVRIPGDGDRIPGVDPDMTRGPLGEPTLGVHPPEVDGSLDREIIQRVVRQQRRQLVHCYEQELQRDPTLSGRVVMTWVVAANGSVVSANVSETTLNNLAVENCLAARIQRWVFPEPEGGSIVRVNYPFSFHRGD